MSPTLRRLQYTTVIVVLIALLVVYVTRAKPLSVSVTEVVRANVEATVANTRAGSIRACRRAKLSPDTGGQITRLHVREGDKVEQNQVLVEIWNDSLKAQLELAKQEAKAANAQAKKVCVQTDISIREAARLAHLLKQKLASEEQTEKAQGEAKAGRAACQAAQSTAAVSEEKIKVINVALDKTILRAPFRGVVAEVNGEVGEFVTPSPVGVATLPVVDIIDDSCIYMEAPIDEMDAAAIQPGMPARITLDAFPNHPFAARVFRIAPYVQDIEKQARTVDVILHFAHLIGEQNLLPGYSADAEIILRSKSDVLAVPTEAIVENNFVYLYRRDSQKVEKRQISKGIGNWVRTEITAGLAEGDLIVTSLNVAGLNDGVSAVVKPATSQ